jgi:hypothetical protein
MLKCANFFCITKNILFDERLSNYMYCEKFYVLETTGFCIFIHAHRR